jgi:hypothetical protein
LLTMSKKNHPSSPLFQAILPVVFCARHVVGA